ncbi:hypothetical protein ACJMK2_034429 [Sinanodonta woodiana]|uniref:Uncharacterized protein n=1 Tax=Sinanodonta woodiana TaxID=1069815 RepID=A0ABD3WV34_SINWO
MSRRNSSTEKYVVYSVDPISDLSSSSEDKEDGHVVLNSQVFQDHSTTPGPCRLESPVISSTSSTEKWGSYWSRRERCCCFLNFVFFVALAVVVAIVILSTKGIVDLRHNGVKESAIHQISSTLAGEKSEDNVLKCTTSAPPPKSCNSEECIQMSAEVLIRMNTSADPCQDFYEFACGGFVSRTRLSWKSPRKRSYPDLILEQYLENIAVSALVDLLGGFDFPYTSSARTNDITYMLASATMLYGVSPFFKVIVKGKNIMLLNRFTEDTVKYLHNTENFYNYRFLQPSDYYYGDEANSEVLKGFSSLYCHLLLLFDIPDFFRCYWRTKDILQNFVATVLGLNETMKRSPSFTQLMDDVYKLEISIHRVMYTEDSANLSTKMSNCEHQMSLRDLSDQYNYSISWSRFFTSLLGTSVNDTFNVCHAELSSELQNVLRRFSPLAIKRYIIITVLLKSDIYSILPERIPRYKESNWEDGDPLRVDGTNRNYFCVNFMSKFIPCSFDKAPSMIVLESTMTLFSELITSLTEIIRSMYWVPLFQTEHLLKTFTGFNMGYTADIFNFSILENITVNQNLFDNFHSLITFKYRQYFRKNQLEPMSVQIQRLVKVSEEFIDLPFAVLKPPLFYSQTSLPLFYGSFGTFISQLLSEVFDLDALVKLLMEEKLDHRVALTIAFRLQCLVEHYSQYNLLQTEDTTYKIRGELSKSQNFKDSLALRVAYNAYARRVASQRTDQSTIMHLPYLPTQLFFIVYAQTMCEKVNDRGMMMHYVQSDDISHIPGKFRVIGTLSNFKPFSSAFQCSKNSPMVRETECSLF